MTNFQFLQSQFKPLYEPANGAEQLVHFDPPACCIDRIAEAVGR